MSFEIYAPRVRGERLRPGQVSCDGKGVTRFTPTDLSAVKIDRSVVVLVDAATRRIAVRAPRCDEDGVFQEPSVAMRRTKTGSSARCNLAGPLSVCGIDSTTVKGVHTLTVKDDLLIVTFNDSAVQKSAKSAGRKAKR